VSEAYALGDGAVLDGDVEGTAGADAEVVVDVPEQLL